MRGRGGWVLKKDRKNPPALRAGGLTPFSHSPQTPLSRVRIIVRRRFSECSARARVAVTLQRPYNLVGICKNNHTFYARKLLRHSLGGDFFAGFGGLFVKIFVAFS